MSPARRGVYTILTPTELSPRAKEQINEDLKVHMEEDKHYRRSIHTHDDGGR